MSEVRRRDVTRIALKHTVALDRMRKEIATMIEEMDAILKNREDLGLDRVLVERFTNTRGHYGNIRRNLTASMT